MVTFIVTSDDGAELLCPDGTPLRASYSEIPLGVEPGTQEYRKQRRLADNRRSAAKSRARTEHEANTRAVREKQVQLLFDAWARRN